MKIMVSFDNRVRPDSTGMYLLSGFRQLGHEVDHVLPEKTKDLQGGYDLYVKCDDGLRITRWNPDLHPSHFYAIDTHIETDWRLALAEAGKFDSISVVHSQGLDLKWCKPPVWIPVGCDPEQHNVGPREKKYDVCFIGNFHTVHAARRIEYVDALFREFPNFFFGNRMFKDMTEKYAESRVVFNCSLNKDVNMRFFEALASGSCLVTDRTPDQDKLGFKENEHYAGYSDIEEMVKVVRNLLDNPEYREGIALAGQKKVLAEHTYAERCRKIIEVALKEKEPCLP